MRRLKAWNWNKDRVLTACWKRWEYAVRVLSGIQVHAWHFLPRHGWSGQGLEYQDRKKLDQEKIDVGKFGCPPSCQIFPSMLRMLCAKMQ